MSTEIVTYLVGLIASIVLILVQHAIRKWLEPKVSKETAELLEKLATAGVKYAEQKSASAFKDTGVKMPSAEKLERAISHVMIEADSFGILKNITKTRVEKYVEAALQPNNKPE